MGCVFVFTYNQSLIFHVLVSKIYYCYRFLMWLYENTSLIHYLNLRKNIEMNLMSIKYL
jgi:hypothetical protein